MKVGFSGTQVGMNEVQRQCLRAFLTGARTARAVVEFHHGDCIGADEQAHGIAQSLAIPVVLHPPTLRSRRAFCEKCHQERPAAPFLVRNHEIVDEVDVLVAAPSEDQERVRSGTWATVRYAKKTGKPVVLLPRGESR